jgi:DNA-binding IclR family transcriptional regulator
VLQQLASRTRELARLTVPAGEELVWLASAQGAPPGLVYQPSMEGPLLLHATANGKAFLATLPDAEALRLARRGGLGTRQPTPRTLADPAALLAALQDVRTRGYAVADQEAEFGVTAVAVAIAPNGGPALGTVSVAGPTLRMPPDRIPDLMAALREAATALAAVWPHRRPA